MAEKKSLLFKKFYQNLNKVIVGYPVCVWIDENGKPKYNQKLFLFFFMLLFGGGIASVPFKNPYEHSEIAEYWKKYVRLAAKEDRNDEEYKQMKDALKRVEAQIVLLLRLEEWFVFY